VIVRVLKRASEMAALSAQRSPLPENRSICDQCNISC
jgi:hypothetical protein